MAHTHQHHHTPEPKQSWWFTWPGMVCIGILAAVGYMLIIDHREHFYSALPWLILLLCPAMHLFMHHGHDHNHPPSGKRED